MGGSEEAIHEALEEGMELRPMSFSTSSVPAALANSNAPVSLATTVNSSGGRVCVQQPVMKVSQMTIHNITMMQDRQQLIVASDTQTQLGLNSMNGPIFGKISKGRSAPKPQQQQQQQQQVTVQQGHLLSKPVASTVVQIVAAPQLVATCAGQISGTPVTPTFATTAKPISTPIPIASKPINSSLQSGVVIPAPGKPGRAASMSSISMQPAAILPNPQTANVGTIVLQPGSQYGSMTLLNASGLSAAQSPKVQAGNTSVHTTMNSQGFMTTLRNIAPPQSSSQAQKVSTSLSL